MRPSPLRGRGCPQANTQEKGDKDKIRTTHRKGWSGSMGGVAYSNSKSRLENE
jgi:hypothetical protein